MRSRIHLIFFLNFNPADLVHLLKLYIFQNCKTITDPRPITMEMDVKFDYCQNFLNFKTLKKSYKVAIAFKP